MWWIKRKSNYSVELFREHHAWHERDPESFTDHGQDRSAIAGLIANLWSDPARSNSHLHELKCTLVLFHDPSFLLEISGSYGNFRVQAMSRRNKHAQLISRDWRHLNPLRGEEHKPDINDALLNPFTHLSHGAFKKHDFYVRIRSSKTG